MYDLTVLLVHTIALLYKARILDLLDYTVDSYSVLTTFASQLLCSGYD